VIDNRGLDRSVHAIPREIKEIWKAINALRSERRTASTTIGDGGLRIDGGDLVMLSEDGDEVFRIGPMQLGDRGLVVRHDDGTVAIEMRRLSGANFVSHAVAIRDHLGISAVETDGLFGGARAPFLEHPFQPVAATTGTPVTCGPYGWERTTSAGTWETLFVYDGKRQNPFLDVKLAALCSDATTAAEVRLVNLADGQPLPDFNNPTAWMGVVPAGTTAYAVLDPGPAQAVVGEVGAAHTYIRLGIQARRTAGTGSITLAVPQSIGG